MASDYSFCAIRTKSSARVFLVFISLLKARVARSRKRLAAAPPTPPIAAPIIAPGKPPTAPPVTIPVAAAPVERTVIPLIDSSPKRVVPALKCLLSPLSVRILSAAPSRRFRTSLKIAPSSEVDARRITSRRVSRASESLRIAIKSSETAREKRGSSIRSLSVTRGGIGFNPDMTNSYKSKSPCSSGIRTAPLCAEMSVFIGPYSVTEYGRRCADPRLS